MAGITWNALRDFDPNGADLIEDELIVIPTGAPVTANPTYWPEFWPSGDSPINTSLQIWQFPGLSGTRYGEVHEASSVGSGQYHCDYWHGGLLTFSSVESGNSVYATYREVGSFVRATKHWNDIHNAIGSGALSDDGGNVNLKTHMADSSIHSQSAGATVWTFTISDGESGTLASGDAVWVSGSAVVRANASAVKPCMGWCVGVTAGQATIESIQGRKLSGIATLNSGDIVAGDVCYLSETAGKVTKSTPHSVNGIIQKVFVATANEAGGKVAGMISLADWRKVV